MKKFIRDINESAQLYRDDKSGIAWIEDGSTGLYHSVHPNIDASGSVQGMKKLGYWEKNDKCVKTHGYIYNISRFVASDDLDKIVADECQCEECKKRRDWNTKAYYRCKECGELIKDEPDLLDEHLINKHKIDVYSICQSCEWDSESIYDKYYERHVSKSEK